MRSRVGSVLRRVAGDANGQRGIRRRRHSVRHGDATLQAEHVHAAGAEDIKIGRDPLPPGWSIHEIGTARMGDDPKTSVTDRFCRLHDIKNVYLADGAPFVSGGTQNTTWTILAMAWQTMDHLKEELRAGNV